MRQWAISVGINQYQSFQPLSYAQHDAQAIQQFLVNDVGVPVEQCVLLTETSPSQWNRPTYPDRENIQGWLDLLTQRYVQPGDVFWFFFSGYGICQQGQDYLVPIAGTPAAVQATAIPLEAIFRTLRRVSDATVLVLLDINRNESSFSYETVGNHTQHLASITGIPTILSCQPGQFSRETSALGHGFFTATLLDSFRSSQGTTIDTLDRALSTHLPELSEHYWRPIQQPVTICPVEKRQQLILPAAFRTHQVADRPVTTQTAIANGAAFLAMQTTARAERLNLANGSTNGSGVHQPERTTIPAAPASEALYSTNGAHANGGTIAGGATMTGTAAPSAASSQQGLNGSASSSRQSGNGFSAIPVQSNGAGTSSPIDTAAQNGENGVTYSDRAATVSQPHSDSPEDPNEISDALFWRSVLRWGGLAVVGLILGVLLRNCAAFTPKAPSTAQESTTTGTGNTGAAQPNAGMPLATKPTAAQTGVPANASTAPAVSLSLRPASTQLGASGASRLNESVGKPATAQLQPAQTTGTVSIAKTSAPSHLAKARMLVAVNSDQASPYSDAIREAKLVQPGQPDYAQAKQEIVGWSRQILSIARQRGRQGRFDAAIVAVRLIPQDQPVHTEAKSAIDRWCPALKKQRGVNPVQRQQAKAICQKGIG